MTLLRRTMYGMYLQQHYSDEARQVLEERYGDDIIVKTESRIWRGFADD
jgi:hypothetical protein